MDVVVSRLLLLPYSENLIWIVRRPPQKRRIPTGKKPSSFAEEEAAVNRLSGVELVVPYHSPGERQTRVEL